MIYDRILRTTTEPDLDGKPCRIIPTDGTGSDGWRTTVELEDKTRRVVSRGQVKERKV